jgi:small subunit ribosomal protein S1
MCFFLFLMSVVSKNEMVSAGFLLRKASGENPRFLFDFLNGFLGKCIGVFASHSFLKWSSEEKIHKKRHLPLFCKDRSHYIMTTETAPMESILKELDFKMPELGDVVTGIVIAKEPGYILISVGGVAVGIIAGREMQDGFETAKSLEIGDEVSAFVLDDENEEGMMVLSLRKASQMRNWDYFERCLETGEVITVVAREANKGGLICDANGVHAFLPVSQLSPQNYPRVDGANAQAIIDRLNDFLGKKFTVRVITFLKNDKIIVSEREAMSDIRNQEIKKLNVGDVVEGEVNGVVKFGVFITFGNLEGLIHTSELSWEQVRNHYELFKIGDAVKAQVIGIDGDKISLSIKRLQKDPWADLIKKYTPGTITKGTVNKVTNFGLFVTIDGNLNGLVHTSEFEDPEMRSDEVARVGDDVTVKVLGVNEEDHNLKLSMKLKEEKKVEKDHKKEEEASAENTEE